MADIPPPPPGFTLDTAPEASAPPPPPPGFTLDAPDAAPAIVKLAPRDFDMEVAKRVRAGQSAQEIRDWATTVRDPNDPTGTVIRTIGPELEQVVDNVARGSGTPVEVLDVTEGDPLMAALRGGLDAGTFNFGDEITAAAKSMFGDSPYEEYLRQERAARAIDEQVNPNERLAGEGVGTVASAFLPLGKVLEAPKLLGWGGRVARGAGVGAAMSGLSGIGAAQDAPEALERLPADLLTGATIGAVLPAAGAGVNYVKNNLTSQGSAISAIEALGLSPAVLRAEAEAFRKATGRTPTVADVLGPRIERLRSSLAGANETRYAAADAAETAGREMLAGVRERAASVPLAEEAQALAEARLRPRLAGPRFDPDEAQRELQAGARARLAPVAQAEEAQAALEAATRPRLTSPAFDPEVAQRELQAGFRERMAGVPAASRSELDARVREIDKANYGAIESEVVQLPEEDLIIVRDVLSETPMASATKTGTRTEEGIAQRLEENRLTGLDFQVIRENLLAGPRGVIVKTGKTFQNLAEDLDQVIDANLPSMTKARRASFEARSVAEGASAAQGAVKELGANPITEAADLRMLTPEQKAGITQGGAQGVLDRTSDPVKAERFAEKLTTDPDYAANVRSVLPPGLGNMLAEWASPARAKVEELRLLGLTDAAKSPTKFENLTNRLLDDPQFLDTLRRRAPDDLIDSMVNYARVQRDVVQRAKSLGLDKAADSPARAMAFAERLDVDPAFAAGVREVLPPGIGDTIIEWASPARAKVEQLRALGLTDVAGSPAKFETLTNRLLDDPRFLDTLRRRAPNSLVDSLVNYARVQRGFLQQTKKLGLDKVADDVNKSYNFARRAEADPEYAAAVVASLPAGVGDELVRYAVAQKRAVDNLTALAGVPPESVPTVLSNASEMITAATIAAQGGGAAIVSSMITNVARELGLGRGPALKLAENLFNPAQFERTIALLEQRGVSKGRLNEVVRNAFFKVAAEIDKDNTRPPEGTVTVGQPQ